MRRRSRRAARGIAAVVAVWGLALPGGPASAQDTHTEGSHAAGGGPGAGRGGTATHPGPRHGTAGEHGSGSHHVPGADAEDEGADHGSSEHGAGGPGGPGGSRGRGAHGAGGGPGGAGEQPPGDATSRGYGRAGGRGGDAGDAGAAGSRPVWAAEGLPDVELGRLNVARSPSDVLDRAGREALAGWSDASSEWYGLPLDEALARLPELPDGVRVESPLANLALYRDVLRGDAQGTPLAGGDRLALAARFLGAASDKTMPVYTDTVVAVNRILGVGQDLGPDEIRQLTRDAEAVRAAILAAHDAPVAH